MFFGHFWVNSNYLKFARKTSVINKNWTTMMTN